MTNKYRFRSEEERSTVFSYMRRLWRTGRYSAETIALGLLAMNSPQHYTKPPATAFTGPTRAVATDSKSQRPQNQRSSTASGRAATRTMPQRRLAQAAHMLRDVDDMDPTRVQGGSSHQQGAGKGPGAMGRSQRWAPGQPALAHEAASVPTGSGLGGAGGKNLAGWAEDVLLGSAFGGSPAALGKSRTGVTSSPDSVLERSTLHSCQVCEHTDYMALAWPNVQTWLSMHTAVLPFKNIQTEQLQSHC